MGGLIRGCGIPQFRAIESLAKLVAAGGKFLLLKVKCGVNWGMRGVAIEGNPCRRCRRPLMGG